MYDVGRKPTKIHVFAQQICPVFSVCQGTLFFIILGGLDCQRHSVGNYERIFYVFFRVTSHGENVSLMSSNGISSRFINECNRIVDCGNHP